MKIPLLTFVIIIISTNIFGQLKNKDIKAGEYKLKVSAKDSIYKSVFEETGELPEFPGGIDSLYYFGKRNIYFPEDVARSCIFGTVVTEFEVDSKGYVKNGKITRSLFPKLDSICISMIQKMPRWKPGRIQDINIDLVLTWRINFILKKDDN